MPELLLADWQEHPTPQPFESSTTLHRGVSQEEWLAHDVAVVPDEMLVVEPLDVEGVGDSDVDDPAEPPWAPPSSVEPPQAPQAR